MHGRSGSFVLEHSGTLTKGAAQQSITVVPDSGAGQLVGLTGKMIVTTLTENIRTTSNTRSPKRRDERSSRYAILPGND